MKELTKCNVTIPKVGYLCTYSVVGYRAADDIKVMKRSALRFVAMVVDEMCPLFSVAIKMLIGDPLKGRP